ncbi:hypothetical protein OKW30_003545 [Paraburkholderia sp. Clong3]|uniref:hypothetical protein n=1 Tax=Paraburkholderia sp. Clong3 TaxID=2991061 RepID=UPI003D20C2EA
MHTSNQEIEMRFCPLSGEPGPVPDSANAWRKKHGVVWLFNPWTGLPRPRLEIERDEEGGLLVPPDEESFEWEPQFVMNRGAARAIALLEQGGWTGEVDAFSLVIKASRGALTVTFRLMEPGDEERFYSLVHDETRRHVMR